jgi:hypothetical protein
MKILTKFEHRKKKFLKGRATLEPGKQLKNKPFIAVARPSIDKWKNTILIYIKTSATDCLHFFKSLFTTLKSSKTKVLFLPRKSILKQNIRVKN